MYPKVRKAEYSNFSYSYLKKCRQPTSKEELFKYKGIVGLTANEHLNNGNRIEDYIADVEVDWNFPLNVPQSRYLEDTILPIGIAMAHKAVNFLWNGWSPQEWLDLIVSLYEELPFATFILLGAYWDKDLSNELIKYLDSERIPYIDLVGRLSLAESLSVIKQLKLFFSFASGLSILATKFKINTIMLYPKKLEKLMYAWPSIESMVGGWYMPFLWERPIEVLRGIKRKIKEVADGCNLG